MQKMWTEDGRLHVQTTTDPTSALETAAHLRRNGLVGDREKKLLAVVPMHLWEAWAREAGLKFNDSAMSDVMARKLNDPDYAHLRVWEGKF